MDAVPSCGIPKAHRRAAAGDDLISPGVVEGCDVDGALMALQGKEQVAREVTDTTAAVE